MPEFPIVEFRNVGYLIDGQQILDGIDLQVARGEILILLGESGCGKTTYAVRAGEGVGRDGSVQ